jgi:hypothetical protein
VEPAVKHRITATPQTFVRYAKVHDEVDRPRGVREERRQLDVSAPLTSAVGHLSSRCLSCCADEVCELGGRPVMRHLSVGVSRASVHVVTECVKLKFLAATGRGRNAAKLSVN